MPQRERQTRLYRDVLEAAGERHVVFRTVDIGGDKSLPYLRSETADSDENPSMGWRGLRLALEREGLLKAQARALLEAAGGRTLNVMFPLVSEPWEFDAARDLFEQQVEFLKKQKKTLPVAINYGVMLEVPALAEVLDLLLPKIAFLSIGTNDLTQFLFAADRANPKLAERYDWVSPSILRFIRRVVIATAGQPVDVTVCGEMGGRRLEALALLGLGIERLSITPAAVGPIKSLVRKVDLGEIRSTMNGWLATPPPDMRKALEHWAGERAIDVD
jgi:phosphotransferase system enzyme I (PtsP)